MCSRLGLTGDELRGRLTQHRVMLFKVYSEEQATALWRAERVALPSVAEVPPTPSQAASRREPLGLLCGAAYRDLNASWLSPLGRQPRACACALVGPISSDS